MDTVHGVEGILGYHFTDPWILWEALQAAGSSVWPTDYLAPVHANGRLAILGGRVLELALAETWYEGNNAPGNRNTTRSDLLGLHADVDPVVHDQIQQQVGSTANLDKIGRGAGLVAFVGQDPSTLGVVSAVTMSVTVKAILGAIYLDSDLNKAKNVMNILGLVLS
ncbi:MAG: hypothetical protein Q9161_007594 [Pseudevernia consocians]